MSIQVRHLSKSFDGVPVLRDVSFSAEKGITCLMAPSGAGKTTLLRILLGLERADGGDVSGLDGARISAVFQEDRLLPNLTAEGNLRFVLGAAYGAEKANALLGELGLEDVGGKPVREFSGGMKRRLALARALSVPFDVLALDEPFTGLDAGNRQRAVACILKWAADAVVVLVTHDRSDAEALNAAVVTL
jgi:NitT/TauT family transport system ATP-binding protein